jgi:lipoprotein-anchoring transpeptidase ErfK/SrfK
VAGRAVAHWEAVSAIVRTLRENRRGPVVLPVKTLRPKVRASDFGSLIVIRRDSKGLYLYQGERFVRRFSVATGQAIYPTPTGDFHIITMWRNPWWYPPDSAWAKGEKPVPPGPGNPLGTRWMGISAPGVGMHGTPDPASIGYSASHGCIRMYIPDAEWLFQHVQIGTPVFIRPV